MAVEDLSIASMQALWGDRHELTGAEYISQEQQPYDHKINSALRNLSIASFGMLQVRKDDASATTVRIMPGRAIVGDAVLDYAGGTIDLAAHNGDTALVALQDDGTGDAEIVADTSWPAAGTPHIRLAEVVVADSAIAEDAITDRRSEHALRQGAAVDDIASPSTASAEDVANKVNALLAALRDVGLIAVSA